MDDGCLEAYLDLCRRYELPGSWAFVAADPRAFRGPADPAAACAALRSACSDEALLTSGLLHTNAAGVLELNPFLAVPDLPVVALREMHRQHMTNLMTPQGCVTGFRYPMFATLYDDHTYRCLTRAENQLMVTGSLEDAIVLRSLGFAAAPIVGLVDLDDYGLGIFEWVFGARCNQRPYEVSGIATPLPRTPAEQTAARVIYPPPKPWSLPGFQRLDFDSSPVELTIANWSPATLSLIPPPAVQPAIEFLMDMKKHYGMDAFAMHLWSPADPEMALLRFALDRRELKPAVGKIFESLEGDVAGLAVAYQHLRPGPAEQPLLDLATARERMRTAFGRDANDSESSKQRATAVADYKAALDRQLVGPIIRQAEQDGDLMALAAAVQFVDLYELFTDRFLAVRERISSSSQDHPRTLSADDRKDVSEILAMCKQLTALSGNFHGPRHAERSRAFSSNHGPSTRGAATARPIRR